jgi:hypothetical protein
MRVALRDGDSMRPWRERLLSGLQERSLLWQLTPMPPRTPITF